MVLKKGYRIAIAITGMIFFTCLFCMPGDDFPETGFFSSIPFFDKWVHMGIFCTIIIMWSWAIQLVGYKSLIKLVLLAAVYGYLIEVIQGTFTTTRSYDLTDLLADIAGSIIGMLIWMQWNRYQKNRPL